MKTSSSFFVKGVNVVDWLESVSDSELVLSSVFVGDLKDEDVDAQFANLLETFLLDEVLASALDLFESDPPRARLAFKAKLGLHERDFGNSVFIMKDDTECLIATHKNNPRNKVDGIILVVL
jgi:hypothetical protein